MSMTEFLNTYQSCTLLIDYLFLDPDDFLVWFFEILYYGFLPFHSISYPPLEFSSL